MMTKHIPDFERYESRLSRIVQKTNDWCIPANIESVTKYFEPDSPVTQDYLWKKWREACKSDEEANGISFDKIKEKVLDIDPNYSRLHSATEIRDIAALAFSNIPSKIDRGPVIISLPAEIPGRMHMYTVVGCNKVGGFHVHDTGSGKLLWKTLEEMRTALKERNRTETDILIIRPK